MFWAIDFEDAQPGPDGGGGDEADAVLCGVDGVCALALCIDDGIAYGALPGAGERAGAVAAGGRDGGGGTRESKSPNQAVKNTGNWQKQTK